VAQGHKLIVGCEWSYLCALYSGNCRAGR